MDALSRISTAVSDLADPVNVLAAVTEEVAPLFDSRLALTFILGEGVRGRHVIVSEPALRDGAESLFYDQMRDPSGWLEALRRRDFSLLDNRAETSLMAEDWKARVPAEDMGRLLVVPLLVQGSAVGALAIFRARKSRSFQERDRRLAESIANILTRTIGVAVQTEELGHFFAASLDLLCRFDAAGRLHHLNPQWDQVLGYDPQELEGALFLDLVHPEDRPTMLAVFADLFGANVPIQFVSRFRASNGSYRSMEWLARPGADLVYASGRDITARLAQEQALRESDITERKAAENALRENRKRLEDLMFVVGDWIWEADAEYHYTQCSDGVRAVLGYAPSEVIGRKPWDFMTAHDAEEMRRYALDRVAKKQGCSEVVNRNLHRDGREVILLTSCVPILDDSGELLGFRGIDKDITIATQTQESLRRSVVELNALWQIAETVAGPGELIAALNSVTRQISDALEARFALVVTFGEGGEGRHIVASRPAETARYEEIFLQRETHHFGLLAKIAESGEPVVINDILTSEILPKEMTQKVETYGFSRLLLIPLVLQTQIIGTLMVTRGPEGSPFRERDIEFAQAAAGSVAAAVVHARLRVEENVKTADQVRDHLARELHDAVTQSVYSASLIAQALPTIWQRSPDDGLVGLGQLQRLVRSALAELRILLYELRPGTLAGVGLDQLLDRLGDSLAGQADVAVEIDSRIEEPPPAEVKEALYRIAQEAFNNIAKHARARRVLASAVTGRWGAVLEVEDDGVGVDVEAIEGDHMGLAIMRERADEIGAEFRIDRIEPSGTRLTVRWVAPEGVLGGRQEQGGRSWS
jgi:PAS domain S-box-containing protein